MDMFSKPDGGYNDSPTQNLDIDNTRRGLGSFQVNCFLIATLKVTEKYFYFYIYQLFLSFSLFMLNVNNGIWI